MDIIHEFKYIPNLSLALGFFDGVHLGHRAVLEKANAVVTFKNHPLCTLKQVKPKYILPRSDAYSLFGVDYVVELNFDEIVNLSAQEYLSKLIEYFKPKNIISGFNHHFGADKKGSPDLLRSNNSYNYIELPPTMIDGEIVSSSAIRQYISKGQFKKANAMLGREFYICGKVIKGQQIGRTIGFPTANILWREDIIAPKYGVYKVIAELIDGTNFDGVANFGIRPTISNDLQSRLEVYLKNFKGDLYDQKIKVKFLNLIREEKKFNSLEELKEQIKIDIKMAE